MGPRPRMGGGPGRRGPAHQRARRDSRAEAQLPRVLPASASPRARGRVLRMAARGPGGLWPAAGLKADARLHELLRPLPAGALESFVVSPRLNSSRMDDPSVQEPSAPPVPKPPSPARPADRPQRSLFEDEDGNDAA